MHTVHHSLNGGLVVCHVKVISQLLTNEWQSFILAAAPDQEMLDACDCWIVIQKWYISFNGVAAAYAVWRQPAKYKIMFGSTSVC